MMFSVLNLDFFGDEAATHGQQPSSRENGSAAVSASKCHRILVANVSKRRGGEQRNSASITKVAVVVEGKGHVSSGTASGLNPEWDSEFLVDLGIDNTGLRREAFHVCVLDAATNQPLASASIRFVDIMDAQPQVLKAHWRALGRCPATLFEPLQVAFASKQKVRCSWP